MTTNKSRRRRAEIERWFQVREREGLTLRGLAARSGIPFGTLCSWSHRLRQEQAPSGFVELGSVEGAQQSADSTGNAPLSAELRVEHPSGLVLEFRGEVAHSVVDRLVEGIARWS